MSKNDWKYFWYCFRLFMIRFVITGLTGYIVEVLYTSISGGAKVIINEGLAKFFENPGAATQAHTGIGAFMIYCWGAVPFTFLMEPLKKWIPDNLFGWKIKTGWLPRAIVYGLIFMTIEFITGFTAKYIFGGSAGWDYSHLPLNFLGIISLVILPLWCLVGFIGEIFNDRLTQIDDILANPKDFNTDTIVKAYIEKHYGKQNDSNITG